MPFKLSSVIRSVSVVVLALSCARHAPAASGADVGGRATIGPKSAPRLDASRASTRVRTDASSDVRWADSVLATLSLRDKAAQMVWVWTLGDYSASDAGSFLAIERVVREQRVGGAIMSVGGPIDIAVKANALQRAAAIPLLLGADLETGAGFRARGGYFLPNAIELGGATTFPYQMAIGATRDTALAYEMGRVTAIEGRAMGLHMAFAPVLDVNNNPRNPVISARSFGEDPALVARMGAAFVRGVQEHGMLATGKHFPGHGDTEQNSHLELARVPVSRARLDSVELRPFREAIRAGVRGMMTFHGDLPALDSSKTAATLSPKVMIDLLQKEMGFRGILVTDALDMNGVLGALSMGEATQRAVIAGNDVLLMPTDVKSAIDAVVAGVASGRFTEARVDTSVRKLLIAKRELGLDRNRYIDVERVRESVATEPNLASARIAAERSITLVHDSAGLIPMQRLSRNARVVSIAITARTELGANRVFDAELKSSFPSLLSLTLSPEIVFDATAGAAAGATASASNATGTYRASPTPALLPASVQNAIDIASGAEIAIVSSYIGASTTTATMAATGGLAELIDGLQRAGTRVVLVSFANPYLAMSLPKAAAHLVAWSPWAPSQRAAARALLGKAPITGQLPVTIPGVAPFGAGIRRQS